MDEVIFVVYRRVTFQVDKRLERLNEDIEQLYRKYDNRNKNLIKLKTNEILQADRDWETNITSSIF